MDGFLRPAGRAASEGFGGFDARPDVVWRPLGPFVGVGMPGQRLVFGQRTAASRCARRAR